MTARILVFGSRDYDDDFAMKAVLDGLLRYSAYGKIHLIEGGAPGADRMAGHYAAQHADKVDHRCFEADWEHCAPECPSGHRRNRKDWRGSYCPTAGHRRNQQMIDTYRLNDSVRITVAIGFLSKPLSQSRGSADMTRRLQEAKVRYFHVLSPRK